MPVLSTGPGTTQMFHDSLMNEWIMDVEINTLVSESLRGGRGREGGNDLKHCYEEGPESRSAGLGCELVSVDLLLR